MSIEEAKRIFGIEQNNNLDNLKKKFRELAKKAHPDVGGNLNEMEKINAAYSVLKKDLIARRNSGSNEIIIYRPQEETRLQSGSEIIPYKGGEITPYKRGKLVKYSGGEIIETIGEGVKGAATTIGDAIKTSIGGIGALTETAGRAIIEIIEKKTEEYKEKKAEEELYKFDPNDIFEILEALERTGDFRILKNINPKFLDDPYFMKLAIDILPESIYYASDNLKDNSSFMLDCYDNNPEMLYFASKRLKNDKEFILGAIEIYPCGTLEFCNRDFRKDEDIIKKAVSIDGLAYRYASFELQNNKDIIKAALNQNSKAIDFINQSSIINNNLFDDPDFAIVAIKENKTEYVDKINDKFWKDPVFVLKSLKANRDCINKIDDELLNDVNFVKKIVDINPKIIERIPDDIKNDVKFAKYCVEKDGNNLKYFNFETKSNKEIVEAALGNNIDAFRYAAPGLALDDYFIKEVAKKLGVGPNKSLYEDKKYLKAVIEANGVYAWERLKEINPYARDLDVVITLLRNSKPEEIDGIIGTIYRQDPKSGRPDYFYLTVNGENPPGSVYKTFLLEASLSKKDYFKFFETEAGRARAFGEPVRRESEYDDGEVDYILQRAKKIGGFDLDILNYFPSAKRNNKEFMMKLEDEYGLGVLNYYTGSDRNSLARLLVKKYGVESIVKLNDSYLSNTSFIAYMIIDYGEKTLDYINLDNLGKDAVDKITKKVEEIKRLQKLKSSLNEISNKFNNTNSSQENNIEINNSMKM